MFEIGDKVAHPGHGACILEDICERTIGDERIEFYELSPYTERTTSILVPIDNAEEIGIRDIISREEAIEILETLPNIESEWTTNHHKRYQDSMDALKSSGLDEASFVLNRFMSREQEARLTNTDREMMRKMQRKILSEVSLAVGRDYEELLEDLENVFLEQSEAKEEATA